MKTIWKYVLQVRNGQAIDMPEGARVLCVQVQRGVPCMWVEVDDPRADAKPLVARWFRTYGTGHAIDGDPGTYIGTYQVQYGDLVFHVYEVSGPREQ